MRQIHIFFKFSKAIRQFAWLFTCFVRVANMVVNLKLFKKESKQKMTQESKQKQFHVHNHVRNSYKTRKSTLSWIGNSEENIDLSRIYLAVHSKVLLMQYVVLTLGPGLSWAVTVQESVLGLVGTTILYSIKKTLIHSTCNFRKYLNISIR